MKMLPILPFFLFLLSPCLQGQSTCDSYLTQSTSNSANKNVVQPCQFIISGQFHDSTGNSFLNVNGGASFPLTSNQMVGPAPVVIGNCDVKTQFQSEQTGTYSTEGFTGCVIVPSTSTIYQSNTHAGFIVCNSSSTNCVAIYMQAVAGAKNTKVWGSNPLVSNRGGFSGVNMIGVESDVNFGNSGDVGYAFDATGLSLNSAGTPASSVGYICRPLNPSSGQTPWANCFFVQDGSAQTAVLIGATASSGTSLNSMPLVFKGVNSGGAAKFAQMQASPFGDLLLQPTSNSGVQIASNALLFVPNGIIQTQTSGNKDLAGVLSYSAATTASYTFTGSYTSAPVCTIAPINPGSTTFSITTDSRTTLTVTASGSFTGSVNYHCIGRN